MKRFPWPLAGLILLGFSGAAQAEAPGDMLARYAAEAKTAEPAFDGFSADRGRQFYLREHPTEKKAKPLAAHAIRPMPGVRALRARTR